MFVDIGLKFYAVPSQPTRATLRSRSWVIDFDKFSDKAQVRRATLSCDSSYFLGLSHFPSPTDWSVSYELKIFERDQAVN